MKATFLLSKDPSVESTGDLSMAKLVIELARAAYDVDVICLSSHADLKPVAAMRRVPKSVPRARDLAIRSLRDRRSLVHTRFVSRELIEAVEMADTDIFVADHCYMAEAVISSPRYAAVSEPASILAVSTVVPEALVWRATRGLIGKLEGPRIVRDELRVARSAYTTGTYDRAEADFYIKAGIPRAHWLDLTLPPKTKIDAGAAPPRLVFLGDRRWAPNQEAFVELIGLWPRIAEGIAGAELAVVGAPDPNAPLVTLPDGVKDWGFVDDLDQFLSTCRGMVAPIRTGGGVRVKILDSASRGLPVIGTSQAVGSLDEILALSWFDDHSEIVERARRYLLDPAVARTDGDALFESNESRWNARASHTSVERWLKI